MNYQLTDLERRVLDAFGEHTQKDGELCIGFKALSKHTNLDTKTLTTVCRKLRALELVEFYRGLFTEDGEVAGSGYCISPKGAAFLSPCDDCENEAHYDWMEDANGLSFWEAGHNKATARRVRKCEAHYKKELAPHH